jgi:hypothetical protein
MGFEILRWLRLDGSGVQGGRATGAMVCRTSESRDPADSISVLVVVADFTMTSKKFRTFSLGSLFAFISALSTRTEQEICREDCAGACITPRFLRGQPRTISGASWMQGNFYSERKGEIWSYFDFNVRHK